MFLTVNFHRKSLKQTGIGHYSPIAAYSANRDLALILDVAKFKYDSYWCSVLELYEALKPLDVVSSISRGFLIVKKKYDLQVES
jgi:glutathione gamma-glutamylcysteinyltransferase